MEVLINGTPQEISQLVRGIVDGVPQTLELRSETNGKDLFMEATEDIRDRHEDIG